MDTRLGAQRVPSFERGCAASARMHRCCEQNCCDKMAVHCIKPFTAHKPGAAPEVDVALVRFWEKLDVKSRKALLTVDKKALFRRIRNQYCSRCFGLFVMRYDELKCSAQLDCPSKGLGERPLFSDSNMRGARYGCNQRVCCLLQRVRSFMLGLNALTVAP